ncbi:MAG: hypothetical protein WDZ30_05570 [Cellvibrionaceae bacterium]
MDQLKRFLPQSLSLMIGSLVCACTFAEQATTQDGVYTEEQAQRGQAVYEQHCKLCHDTQFYQTKFQVWNNQPLSALYDSVSFSMPESNPGGLPLQDYTDVMAYIFSLLEYPAGDKELSHTDGSMSNIIVKTK